ncbi:MAG: hypothetical protein ACI89X_003107 [Planctomycetota bacterium]|jgi:hypothetical protein
MRGSLNQMADSSAEGTQPARPPLGSWTLVYTLCCVLAIAVMAGLYWFSRAFNVQS